MFKIKLFLALMFNFGLISADGIIFSFDRPMQLYAYLESLLKNVTGLENLSVIYRSSNVKFEMGYRKVINSFPNISFYKQSKRQEFRPMLLKLFNQASEYIFFSVDDLLVRGHIDLTSSEYYLSKSDYYGFYYRLGKNVIKSYMTGQNSPPPQLIEVGLDIFKFKFNEGLEDWAYPNSVDMVLYKRSIIADDINKILFNTPNSMEGTWASIANLDKYGLCHAESKVVGVPINKVNASTNKFMNSYSVVKLLDLFNKGFRLDYFEMAKIIPESPHMALQLKFKKHLA